MATSMDPTCQYGPYTYRTVLGVNPESLSTDNADSYTVVKIDRALPTRLCYTLFNAACLTALKTGRFPAAQDGRQPGRS